MSGSQEDGGQCPPYEETDPRATDDFAQEVALVREQHELMAFLDQRSSASQTYTLDQVRETLGLD